MATGVGMFFYLATETTTKFLSNKIVLRLSEKEVLIRDIPFPAVTMCPQIFNENFLSHFDRKTYTSSDEKFVKLLEVSQVSKTFSF
jgi:Amiloride-sensitive sodium channel